MSLSQLVAGLINPKPVVIEEKAPKRKVVKLTDTPLTIQDRPQPKKFEVKDLRLLDMRQFVRDRQIDWHKILLDLKREGVNLRELSSAVGCSERWADKFIGAQLCKMDYAIGCALLELHKEVMKGKQSGEEDA